MSDLKILCDDCYLNSGIGALTMQNIGPGCIRELKHKLAVPLGDCYRCDCGRFYGSKAGYFDKPAGKGPSRRRLEWCRKAEHERPMYLTAGISPTEGKFKCPTCGQTKEVTIARIPPKASV